MQDRRPKSHQQQHNLRGYLQPNAFSETKASIGLFNRVSSHEHRTSIGSNPIQTRRVSMNPGFAMNLPTNTFTSSPTRRSKRSSSQETTRDYSRMDSLVTKTARSTLETTRNINTDRRTKFGAALPIPMKKRAQLDARQMIVSPNTRPPFNSRRSFHEYQSGTCQEPNLATFGGTPVAKPVHTSMSSFWKDELPSRPSTADQSLLNSFHDTSKPPALRGFVSSLQQDVRIVPVNGSNESRPRHPIQQLKPFGEKATEVIARDDQQMSQDSESDGIRFTTSPDQSNAYIVYRTERTRQLNPERMNLDRRNLKACPIIEGERRLRLLNLQNNFISQIDNLYDLPNLIFLDLYNNELTKLSNLGMVPSLRVLMLGKNKIKKIDNLEALTKLDVLDLHSNEIEKLENLEALAELRVLNLAGNKLRSVENISELCRLTELNLRRNVIEKVSETNKLENLQTLFLSHNNISEFEKIESVLQSSSLADLTLDGNPLAQNPGYRSTIAQEMPALAFLDLQKFTDKEKHAAYLSTQESIQKERELNRAQQQDKERKEAIDLAKLNWQIRNEHSQMDISWQSNINSTSSPSSKATRALKYRPKAGFSEVEVQGDSRRLYIYGDALEALKTTKLKMSITTIGFVYLDFHDIGEALKAPGIDYLRSFPKVETLIFSNNNLHLFGQLEWLGQLEQLYNLHHLIIDATNPILACQFLRPYLAARFPQLAQFNDEPILQQDIDIGKQLFQNQKHKVYSCPLRSEKHDTEEKERQPVVETLMHRLTRRVLQHHENQQKVNHQWHEEVNQTIQKQVRAMDNEPSTSSAEPVS